MANTQELDEKLINYADLKRYGQNLQKHYATTGSLKLKANATEVYTRSEIDDKLSKVSANVDLTGYAKTEDVEKALQNISGTKGDKGDRGESGLDGKSAYEIAVENGFVGTEAEWLKSLKGEKGADADPVDTSVFAQKSDLEGLAKASDIPSLEGYAKTEDIPDLTGYAKTSDIPKQKTLSELGGVTQAGVESIIQAKDFTSTDTVRQMIADAIAEALKNNGGGDTPTPTPEPDPTPTEPPADGDWAWQKYIVVPAGTTLITNDMDTFFGRTFNHPDEFIGAGEDMKNTTTEFRFIGTLQMQNSNKPAYLINSLDELPNGAETLGVDYSKKYKDGMRVPLDGFDDVAKAAFEEALKEENIITTGIMDYDGEAILKLNLFNVACDQLYMIRTIKEGKIIGDFSLGERIDGKE